MPTDVTEPLLVPPHRNHAIARRAREFNHTTMLVLSGSSDPRDHQALIDDFVSTVTGATAPEFARFEYAWDWYTFCLNDDVPEFTTFAPVE